MRAFGILAGLAAAAVLIALWLREPESRPTGVVPPSGTGESDPTPSSPVVGTGDTQGQEVVRTNPVPAASAQLRGRFVLSAEPQQLLAVVDGEHEVVVDQATGIFESPMLTAGEHALFGVAVIGNFVDVFEARVTVAEGEARNLGDIAPRMAEWGRIYVQPTHPASGRPFDRSEVTRTGLARRRADLLVGGLKVFVPIAKEMALRGLPGDGLRVEIVGAPPTVRLKTSTLYLRRDFETPRIRPETRTTLTLEYAPRVALKVFVDLPPQFPADELDVRLQLFDLATGIEVSGECESYRADDQSGVNTAQGRLIAETGTHLLVARAVRNEAVEVAFGAEIVTLETLGNQATLQATPAWPARGRVEGRQPGEVVEVALAADPHTPLWLAEVAANGTFRLQGVPADQSLVLLVPGAQPQALRAELRDGRLELSSAPR